MHGPRSLDSARRFAGLHGGEGRGKPRLMVFSQARWSRNDGGENCLAGGRSGVALPWTGRVGTCEIRFQQQPDARGHGFPALPIRLSPLVAGLCRCLRALAANRATHDRDRTWAAAANCARCWLDLLCGLEHRARGRAREAFRNARLPPRGVSPLLTSPYPAHCRDASGARRIFATGASGCSRSKTLRPRGMTRQMNSLYQPSVTVGACLDRTCLWAPSLPRGLPCVQLVASLKRGEQPAPGASKISVYRLLPAHAARFKIP